MSNQDEFDAPGGGDFIEWDAVKGALLLFTVHSVERDIDTKHGQSDAVKVDVAALDGEHQGETWDDILVFPKKLRSQLSGKVGGKVLGRLGQGEKQPGKNPPWQLADPTDADKDVARKHIAATAVPESEPF